MRSRPFRIVNETWTLVAGLLLLLIAAPRIASAQTSVPPFEVFAGYSYLPADGDDFPRTASSGFQASAAAHLKQWFSVVVDAAGQYSRSSRSEERRVGKECRSGWSPGQ